MDGGGAVNAEGDIGGLALLTMGPYWPPFSDVDTTGEERIGFGSRRFSSGILVDIVVPEEISEQEMREGNEKIGSKDEA
ncbi:hypothetical protein HC762_01680 [bacterium]|nr:hypothetical protein [bacterium]